MASLSDMIKKSQDGLAKKKKGSRAGSMLNKRKPKGNGPKRMKPPKKK